MNDKKYNSFLDAVQETPLQPEGILDSVIDSERGHANIRTFAKVGSSIAALLIGAVAMFSGFEMNSSENGSVLTNAELNSFFSEDDYDNFDDYFPLANL